MAQEEIAQSLVMAAKSLIEEEPGYSYVAARLLLSTIYQEAAGERGAPAERAATCRARLRGYLEDGVERELLAPALLERFDLTKEKNFFETRVTEYQQAATLSWD